MLLGKSIDHLQGGAECEIEAISMRGEPTPAIARGATEWSLPIDQLGEGARYYQYDPKEARRLLAEAGFAKGFKTPLSTTNGSTLTCWMPCSWCSNISKMSASR